MKISTRILYVPHSGKPKLRKGLPDGFNCDENLVISPQCTVFYNITHSTPNPNLAKFGHILSNIPGDAIFVYDEINIPENFLELLPKILEEDTRKRFIGT